jgi:F0F1-type ATP synthase alpha subunit
LNTLVNLESASPGFDGQFSVGVNTGDLQVKSMSDQAQRLQQQAKQVKARNKLAKAQQQLVKATSQRANH